MNKKLRETAKLCVEIMNCKRLVKGKLAHLKQIRVTLPFRRKRDQYLVVLAPEPASFWRENVVTVVILLGVFQYRNMAEKFNSGFLYSRKQRKTDFGIICT